MNIDLQYNIEITVGNFIILEYNIILYWTV